MATAIRVDVHWAYAHPHSPAYRDAESGIEKALQAVGWTWEGAVSRGGPDEPLRYRRSDGANYTAAQFDEACRVVGAQLAKGFQGTPVRKDVSSEVQAEAHRIVGQWVVTPSQSVTEVLPRR